MSQKFTSLENNDDIDDVKDIKNKDKFNFIVGDILFDDLCFGPPIKNPAGSGSYHHEDSSLRTSSIMSYFKRFFYFEWRPFETKFDERFVFVEGILLPNDIYWFHFVATTRMNIVLIWWNDTPKIIDRLFQFTIIRKYPTNQSILSNTSPKNDFSLIMLVNLEEGGIFWQSVCQRFNLQCSGISKVNKDGCFTFVSRYFIIERYKAGKSFYFPPNNNI
jgi:hypothetical protein